MHYAWVQLVTKELRVQPSSQNYMVDWSWHSFHHVFLTQLLVIGLSIVGVASVVGMSRQLRRRFYLLMPWISKYLWHLYLKSFTWWCPWSLRAHNVKGLCRCATLKTLDASWRFSVLLRRKIDFTICHARGHVWWGLHCFVGGHKCAWHGGLQALCGVGGA
jgi:hypothetical protein